MLRRDKLTIIDYFLEAVSNGFQKSRLMYKANLSYYQFKKYADIVTKKKLVEERKKGIFEVTEKGKEYMRRYHSLAELIE